MLEAHGLSKSYSGIAAVTDVSFAIDPGQVLGCLGPNDSGKSTTVKMLLGIIEPSRGQASVGPRRDRQLTFVEEDSRAVELLNLSAGR